MKMGLKKVKWIALDARVIAVAVEGENKDWSAYIGAVSGKDHTEEWKEVLKKGSKLPKEVAEVLFPDFAEQFRWRD
jgi:hypothetical protein